MTYESRGDFQTPDNQRLVSEVVLVVVAVVVIRVWVMGRFCVILVYLWHRCGLFTLPKLSKDFFLASEVSKLLLLGRVFQVGHTCGVGEAFE